MTVARRPVRVVQAVQLEVQVRTSRPSAPLCSFTESDARMDPGTYAVTSARASLR
jgi:hypothetical protein